METMLLCIFVFATRKSWPIVFSISCVYKFGCGRYFSLLDSHANVAILISICLAKIMSINDKIKVLWKTSCEWRDKPHFPKRKEFQLRDGESEGSLLPLNVGDAAKIKFGSRW